MVLAVGLVSPTIETRAAQKEDGAQLELRFIKENISLVTERLCEALQLTEARKTARYTMGGLEQHNRTRNRIACLGNDIQSRSLAEIRFPVRAQPGFSKEASMTNVLFFEED